MFSLLFFGFYCSSMRSIHCMGFSLGVSSGNNGEVSKRSDTSLKISQSVIPRVSSGLLTPLSQPDNLQAVV